MINSILSHFQMSYELRGIFMKGSDIMTLLDPDASKANNFNDSM